MMYAYLRGVLEKKLTDSVIVDVGGIGYRIHTAPASIHGYKAGTEVKVYTHLYVREDNIALYGFFTEEELKMFEQLISVSGVGPKAAISLVSTIPAAQFGLTVLTEDADSLTKAQGIGKKIAQRIILELKDKLKKEQLDLPEFKDIKATTVSSGKDTRISEAVSALVMLGYSSIEANRAVASSFSDEKTVEAIIKDALKAML